MRSLKGDALARGCVIERRGEIAVVWNLVADRLVVFAIVRPDERRAGDVACDRRGPPFIHGLTVRAGAPIQIGRNGQDLVGTLPPELMRDVAAAALRAGETALCASKWAGHCALRDYRDAPCVNLNT